MGKRKKDKEKKSKDKKSKDKKSKDKKSKDKKSKDKKSRDKKSKDKKSRDKKSKDKKAKDKKPRAEHAAIDRSPIDAITRLLADYGVDAEVTRPQERVLLWAARVHGGIIDDLEHGAAADSLLADMLEEDHRLSIFYLEGILKLYRKRYGALEPLFVEVKALEDKLGQLSAARGFASLARDNGAPEPVCGWLDNEASRVTEEILDLLRLRWLPTRGERRVPAIEDLIRIVLETKFDKPAKDLAFLQREVAGELEELEELELDMSQLQGDFGVHELRRKLRWYPIFCVSTCGLFQLTDGINPIPRYMELLDTELAASKYSQLPPGDRDGDHIEISRSLFVANNGFISNLGSIKDRGEEIEAMELALIGSGMYASHEDARGEALKILGKTMDDFRQIYLDAQVILDELEEVGFATALRSDVDDG